MKYLDPKVIWLFTINYFFGFLFLLIFISVFGVNVLEISVFFVQNPEGYYPGYNPFRFLDFWWLLLIITSILAFIWAKLTYRFYKYELKEDGFRKEHGVIWKKYVTIPYERIQNVDIYRGLLARILGLSDLHIQTAGMSAPVGNYGGVSEGRLPGLSPQIAEDLRDELIKRARSGSKGQGL